MANLTKEQRLAKEAEEKAKMQAEIEEKLELNTKKSLRQQKRN